MLLEAVLSAGLTPQRVVLEITERSLVQLEVVREAKKLRKLGFRLALDDTGAGNAGLEMLSQLAVDFVKIDRSIVVKALTDVSARTILSGITAMARQMNSYVIAEGIEDVEMLDLVQEVGTQAVQGYLIGRPTQALPGAQELQALRASARRASLDHLAAALNKAVLFLRKKESSSDLPMTCESVITQVGETLRLIQMPSPQCRGGISRIAPGRRSPDRPPVADRDSRARCPPPARPGGRVLSRDRAPPRSAGHPARHRSWQTPTGCLVGAAT